MGTLPVDLLWPCTFLISHTDVLLIFDSSEKFPFFFFFGEISYLKTLQGFSTCRVLPIIMRSFFDLVNYNHVSFFRHNKHTNIQHTNIHSNYQHPKIPIIHPVKWFIQSLGLMKVHNSLNCMFDVSLLCSKYSIKRTQRHLRSSESE